MQLTGADRSCDHLVNEHVRDSATSTDTAHERVACNVVNGASGRCSSSNKRPQLGPLSRCFVGDLGHMTRVRIDACASSGSATVCGAQRPRTLGCSATLTPPRSTKTTPSRDLPLAAREHPAAAGGAPGLRGNEGSGQTAHFVAQHRLPAARCCFSRPPARSRSVVSRPIGPRRDWC